MQYSTKSQLSSVHARKAERAFRQRASPASLGHHSSRPRNAGESTTLDRAAWLAHTAGHSLVAPQGANRGPCGDHAVSLCTRHWQPASSTRFAKHPYPARRRSRAVYLPHAGPLVVPQRGANRWPCGATCPPPFFFHARPLQACQPARRASPALAHTAKFAGGRSDALLSPRRVVGPKGDSRCHPRAPTGALPRNTIFFARAVGCQLPHHASLASLARSISALH